MHAKNHRLDHYMLTPGTIKQLGININGSTIEAFTQAQPQEIRSFIKCVLPKHHKRNANVIRNWIVQKRKLEEIFYWKNIKYSFIRMDYSFCCISNPNWWSKSNKIEKQIKLATLIHDQLYEPASMIKIGTFLQWGIPSLSMWMLKMSCGIRKIANDLFYILFEIVWCWKKWAFWIHWKWELLILWNFYLFKCDKIW